MIKSTLYTLIIIFRLADGTTYDAATIYRNQEDCNYMAAVAISSPGVSEVACRPTTVLERLRVALTN